MINIFQKSKYHISGGRLLKALLEIRPRQCEICQNTEWLGQPIKLQVHHIDGDNTNNVLENLQLLCPNCHSYTDSWCKNKIKKEVSDEELIKSIQESETIHQALLKVNLSTSGANYIRAKNLILNNGISLLLPVKSLMSEKHYFCIDCGKEIKTNSTRCPECFSISQRTVSRPDRKELKQLIRNNSFVTIGKLYGVSDNAIRKWCKWENLPYKAKEIKSYSDEEWENI